MLIIGSNLTNEALSKLLDIGRKYYKGLHDESFHLRVAQFAYQIIEGEGCNGLFDIVYPAALLHNIGWRTGIDHPYHGAEMATSCIRRSGLVYTEDELRAIYHAICFHHKHDRNELEDGPILLAVQVVHDAVLCERFTESGLLRALLQTSSTHRVDTVSTADILKLTTIPELFSATQEDNHYPDIQTTTGKQIVDRLRENYDLFADKLREQHNLSLPTIQ